MIREALSSLARNDAVAQAVGRLPGARSVVGRVVAGESLPDALAVATDLADEGFWLCLEHTEHGDQPEQARDDLAALIDAVAASEVAPIAQISIRPEVLGVRSDQVLANVDAAVAHARRNGLAVAVGAAAVVDQADLRAWFEEQAAPDLTVTYAAALRRTEADCAAAADLGRGSVRLVKGGQDVAGAAYRQPIEVDKSYIRSAKHLLRATGEPSFATHDPRLVEILQTLARRYDRPAQSYEFAFYLGRMAGLQERLVAGGERVRLYVPFGPAWFERLVGGLAEQRSSLGSAVRSLLPGAS